jgi:hypothetical protein
MRHGSTPLKSILARLEAEAVGWHLTIMSRGTLLFTASARSRQEVEDLAAAARRLRPNVEILIRPPVGPAYRYE